MRLPQAFFIVFVARLHVLYDVTSVKDGSWLLYSYKIFCRFYTQITGGFLPAKLHRLNIGTVRGFQVPAQVFDYTQFSWLASNDTLQPKKINDIRVGPLCNNVKS